MREPLKIAVGALIFVETLVLVIWLSRIGPWWWGLRKRTRVIIALAHAAVITAVGFYYNWRP